ncbi:PP2C family protein-serine/threonine phosphatase [Leptolyngbya sp. AN02str]|uniref:PP2C family protein-serine/threonine phosphatase n=1 Tax=Leptolyngbya sp. AN02str TaxID=3423363 RepID=UPI003D30FC83
MLYCPNHTCQTLNAETSRVCQSCQTVLPKRYLWGIGDGVAAATPGALLGNRYLCKGDGIFLDTMPGYYPGASAEILSDAFLPYLRLVPYRLHVPQIYDITATESPKGPLSIVLLEHGALWVEPQPQGDATSDHSLWVQPLPAIADLWSTASPLRQLNWLWQLAHLWQPFSLERVASTLLKPDLVRVEDSLIRLLQLEMDSSQTAPNLADLGQVWQQWLPGARPEIAPLLQQTIQALRLGQISSAEQLIAQLDQHMDAVTLGLAQKVAIATATDQGPSRSRNEDACSPDSGTVETYELLTPDAKLPLVIVCDGIGGHEGGNVASHLAIAAFQQQMQPLPIQSLSPTALFQALESATGVANDQISQRNDSEQRHDRKRMGTTLVMSLVRNHELYLTHVGDSRAYWITRRGCHQITLDDDVATREVRLGYSFYREALQHPSSGSLVQALGMGSSNLLHPTVQRFVLDDDGIVLLCSDGLSDNDRVEEYWDTEILPLLDGKTDIATVCQRLVNLANTQNGHDNVTIGLLHYQVSHLSESQPWPQAAKTSNQPPIQAWPQPTAPSIPAPAEIAVATPTSPPQGRTQQVAPRSTAASVRSPQSRILPGLLTLLAVVGLGGLLIYGLLQNQTGWLAERLGRSPEPSPTPTPSPSTPALQPGVLIEIGRTATEPLVLLSQPTNGVPAVPNGSTNLGEATNVTGSTATPAATPAPAPAASSVEPTATASLVIPPGSVLQLVNQQGASPDRWLQVRVCSVGTDAQPAVGQPPDANGSGNVTPPPSTETASTTPLTQAIAPTNEPLVIVQTGQVGWVAEPNIAPLWRFNLTLTPEQQGVCATAPIPSEAPPSSASPAAQPLG